MNAFTFPNSWVQFKRANVKLNVNIKPTNVIVE